MDGVDHFRHCCSQLGIDCNSLFKIGSGAPTHKTRFIYCCNASSRTDTQRYAIKYFIPEDLFIAWDLCAPKAKGKDVFSIAKSKVISIQPGMARETQKNVEYSGWNEETVVYFQSNAVNQFLKKYILENQRREGL